MSNIKHSIPILDKLWIICVLCFLSTSQFMMAQEVDTARLISEIAEEPNAQVKCKLLQELNQWLLAKKDYKSLENYAENYFSLAREVNGLSDRVMASFFLVESAYYQRNYDKAGYYGKIGMGLAHQDGNLEKEAHFANRLGVISRRNDQCDEAVEYYLKAVDINIALQDSAQLSRTYNNLANCYRTLGESAKALNILKEGIAIRTLLKDTSGIGNLYMNMGNTYDEVHNYEKAVQSYLQAQAYYEEAGNSQGVIGSLLNIGYVYQNLQNYAQAVNYYEEAKEFAELNNQNNILGIVNQNLGNIYKNQGRLSEALEYQKRALEIFTAREDLGAKHDALLNIGLIYSQKEELDSALLFLNKALNISKNDVGSRDYANDNLEIGRIYTKTRQFRKSSEFLSRGKELAATRGDKELLTYAHLYFYEMYEARGNSEEALTYFKSYVQLEDSLDMLEQEKSITQIKSQFDFEKQENEIELLNKENQLQQAAVTKAQNQQKILLLFLLLALITVGGLGFLYHYSKKKKAIIAREKDRAESLLLNILPPEAAEELKEHGSIKAVRYENVSVLFTDFVNFSKYSEGIDPEDVVNNVDYYFRYFDQIIEKYGLEKIKTIGDAYMCVGGLPISSEDHALQITAAAKEILEFVRKTKNDHPPGIYPFDIRIGINSGPVVAGVVGIKKFQYDIWGDTVNVAAKMEASAKTGTIAISEQTYALIKDQVVCDYLGIVETKHRQSAKVYQVEVSEQIISST